VDAPVEYLEQDCGYETPCWVWQRCRRGGYGEVKIGGTQVRAHRAYYERFVGPIPDGLQLDHLCRNRACVRPSHLEVVTGFENAIRGVGTLLTPAQVYEIRDRLDGGATQTKLGAEYGVSQTTISDIKCGRSWSKITELKEKNNV